MNLADLYLRLSLEFEGSTSIDRQEVECRRWCEMRGITVRQVHVDRGVSGFDSFARRAGFDAAIQAVASGEVGTLVVWKLDRLSRRGIGQVGEVLDRLEHAGGRLVSVQDQLDTAQPQARMIIALLAEFARAESETMGVRIKSAKQAQRARGLWLSGKPPFGYAIAADRRLRPVEPAATAIRTVFLMLADGHTLAHACRRLNEEGLRNSHGGTWRSSALSAAITTPAYAGLTPERHVNERGGHAAGYPSVYRDRDTGLEVSCLSPGARPIVTRTEQLAAFDGLQRRMARYGRGTGPRRPSHALLIRGLGRCAGCGCALVTHGGYRCRRVGTDGLVLCSTPANALIPTVDKRVTAAWLSLLTGAGSQSTELRGRVARRWSPPSATQPARSGRLRAELADLSLRLDDADAARYLRGELDARRHASVVKKLVSRMARVEGDLNLVGHENAVDATPLEDASYVAARWTSSSRDAQRVLLRLAWSSVLLAKAGHRGGHFDPGRLTYVAAD